MEVRDTCAHARADTTSRPLDTWDLDDAHARITRLIASTQTAPRCPGGEVPARDVHRHDTRRLTDLPWRGSALTWQLRVRTRCCSTPKGPRRVFTERLPGLVAPWARCP
jgi:transposase